MEPAADRRLRTTRRIAAVALAALAASAAPARAADEGAVPFVLRLEEQANEIWSTLPADPGDPRVTLLGDTARPCAADALRRAHGLLAQGAAGRVALRDLSLTLPLPRGTATELGRGNPPPGLLAAHVPAGLRSDHVLQPLADPACEDAGAFYDLRSAREAPGLRLHLLLEAGCGGGRYRIAGESELEPGIAEGRQALRLRARPARYSVLASCERAASPEARSGQARPAALDPCGAPCAPLANGLLAWQKQATEMTGKLADLAGKATAIRVEIDTDRRELDAAQGARRKPRSVLERVSALQAKIKAAEAELARVTRASQEVQGYLAALQGAADDTRAAGDRCLSQCQARQQQRADRAPEKGAGAGGSGPAAAASGGGLSTGVIVAGGAALAAGGVAVATLGGGDDDATTGPAGFPGRWVGTRTTTAQVLPPLRCTRVFDETWVITQNGNELRADITVLPQGCGPAPACPQGCEVFSFDRFHPGFAEGDTARFYVFPGLQVPSCVLPLRLSGNTLSGSMPACDTGHVDTLSDVVSLRRSGG